MVLVCLLFQLTRLIPLDLQFLLLRLCLLRLLVQPDLMNRLFLLLRLDLPLRKLLLSLWFLWDQSHLRHLLLRLFLLVRQYQLILLNQLTRSVRPIQLFRLHL